MGIDQKRCKACRQVKPASEFYRARGYLLSRCKPCTLLYNAALARQTYRTDEYREFNRKKRAAYRAGLGKDRIAAQKRAYHERHPERRRAWAAVARAVAAGTLIRPERCACGRSARVTGHHDDYNQPLAVMWVCDVCHKARHESLARTAVAA